MRVGRNETIRVQALPHTGYGIWVHVIFPHGKGKNWYEQTNHGGFWHQVFKVPYGSRTKTKNKTYVVMRLWHGKKYHDAYRYFFIAP